jgi:hypothetical protein
MPLFPRKTVSTIGELVQVLNDVMVPDSIRWFRGHADHTWKLLPSLARAPNRVAGEQALIKRFKQNAYSMLTQIPEEDWHWLFLMQHHGAPTRLLDWTENPLVALYFVVADPDPAKAGTDGYVWCLDPVGLNKAAFIQPTASGELPFFGVDEDLKKYRTEDVDRSGAPSKPPVAALAPRFFRRLTAQSGVFTVTHRDQIAIEEAHAGAYVGQILIPHGAKKALLKDLAVLGITRLTLFPELDAVAEYAQEVMK